MRSHERRPFWPLVIALGLVICGLLTPITATQATFSTHLAGEAQLLSPESAGPHAFYGLGRFGVGMQYGDGPTDPACALVTGLSYSMAIDYYLHGIGGGLFGADGWGAAASSSHTLVAFSENNGGSYFVFGALYDASGELVDFETIYAVTTPDTEFHETAVAADPNTGNFMVVWREEDDSLNQTLGIYGKKVNVVGDQIDLPFSRVELYTGSAGAPDIVYAQEQVTPSALVERFVVTWSRGNTSGPCYIKHLDANSGAPAAGLIAVPTSFLSASSRSRIASKGDEIIVVWPQWTTGTTDIDVYAMIANPTLTSLGTPFLVAQDAHSPDVAASNDEYLVVFQEGLPPAHEQRILMHYLDFTGASLGRHYEVADDNTANLSAATVASNGFTWIVAYERANGSSKVGMPFDVWVQRIGPEPFTFFDTQVDDNVQFVMSTRGVGWGDWIDGSPPDIRPDVYVVNTSNEPNESFVNDGSNLVFDNTGANSPQSGQGVAMADADNDGDLDIFVSNSLQPDELFENNGSGFYSVGAGNVDGTQNGRSAIWVDYDTDGLVDLLVGNKNHFNYLYRNLGGLSFAVTSIALGSSALNTEGVSFVDIDQNGDPDFYIGNAGHPNQLLVNQGDGTFLDEAASYGLDDAGSARSVSWADINNDGTMELYISKYGQPNSLYVSSHGGYVDMASSLGVDDAGNGESATWADVDLDGDLDLFVANFLTQDRLYLNTGSGFKDLGPALGLSSWGPSLGAAWGDKDGDGDPDLVIGEFGGTNRVFENGVGDGNNWLAVDLQGTSSNGSAIGTVVTAEVHGLGTQTRVVGSGSGYLSQNDLTIIFGLGSYTEVSELTIDWPDGNQEIFFMLSSNQVIEVTESDPTSTPPTARKFGVQLEPNFPNPFNPVTQIPFELGASQEIELSVYDQRGRRVAVLARGTHAAGRHVVKWNGTDDAGHRLASGVYFYRLAGQQHSARRQLTLVK